MNRVLVHIEVIFTQDGEATSPAGPWPRVWPATVLLRGLNPSSSVGTPKVASFDS